jgi:hypothetical protein
MVTPLAAPESVTATPPVVSEAPGATAPLSLPESVCGAVSAPVMVNGPAKAEPAVRKIAVERRKWRMENTPTNFSPKAD